MVQLLLNRLRKRRVQLVFCVGLAGLLLLGVAAASGRTGKAKQKPPEVQVPDLLLAGGRKLTYERSFDSEYEVRLKRRGNLPRCSIS